MKTNRSSSIEPLESRIAPSAVLKFTDVDGDAVNITSSKGTHDDLFLAVHSVTSGQLKLLDLGTGLFGKVFDGANISITVTMTDPDNGDGVVNVGEILATGIDLGTVKVKGDLGRIVVGDGVSTTDALKGLSVVSLGRFGTSTGATDLHSMIDGKLDSLTVTTDVIDAFIDVSDSGGGSSSKIGPITIGGSLVGGAGADSGHIRVLDGMGSVKVGGDIVGGSVVHTGFIDSGGMLGSVTVGGSVIGGAGDDSGEIEGTSMGAVKIGQNVTGGSRPNAGSIGAGHIASITLGGSLIGGSNEFTGEISAENAGAIKIGGSIVGGSVSGSANLKYSGVILAAGKIASLSVGGSILAGTDNSSGTLQESGAVYAGDLGPVLVKGSIVGTVGSGGDVTPVCIVGLGVVSNVAIKSLTVSGGVEHANVFAGYNSGLFATNEDAQIGAVKVGGDWIASNLVAGTQNTPSSNTNFGDGGDTPIDNTTPNLLSKIASITIGGQVTGTAGAGYHFGFVAQQIGSFKLNGTTIPHGAGFHQLANGTTGDVAIHVL